MVLFTYGFRPFFLAAPTFAALAVLAWMLELQGAGHVSGANWPSPFWHAHEMLFGFISAAIGGFLLTAVPSWTKRGPVSGAPLAALLLLWLAGRVAMWTGDLIDPAAVALLDLAYLPALIAAVAPSLLAAESRKHLVFLVLLAFLVAANALMHLEAAGLLEGGFRAGSAIGTDAAALLVAVVGGRVVPAFTRSAFAATGEGAEIRSTGRLDAAGVLSVAALLVAEGLFAPAGAVGALALLAAGLNGLRMVGWKTLATLRWPTVWVLHLGFAWLVAGLAAKGVASLAGEVLLPAAAIHALTIGAFGTMILAIMSRAALGHTGRSTMASGYVAAVLSTAYLLVSASAVLRIASTWAGPLWFEASLVASGILWVAAFLAFLAVFGPILLRPRIDRLVESGSDLA